ncbi:class I SAM-dependent methyltransferase [Bosea sp. (in: a-proteobacteria)]
MSSDEEILALLERWDRQQEGYIEQREERFNVMFDILQSAFGEGFTVVDAACGPGSLSRRLLERFPAAKVIAVDADVMLLEMARVALAADGDRVRVVEADLSHASWSDRVREAVVSLKASCRRLSFRRPRCIGFHPDISRSFTALPVNCSCRAGSS